MTSALQKLSKKISVTGDGSNNSEDWGRSGDFSRFFKK